MSHADCAHPSAASSCDARSRVFHYDAFISAYAEARGRKDVHFRVRLPMVNVFGRNDCLKCVGGPESLQHYVDVGSRGGRRNCLKPSPSVQCAHPVGDPWQRRDSMLANQVAVEFFLCVSDMVETFRGSRGPEPLRNDGVIALTEGRKKLFPTDDDTFVRHRFSPRKPMELL